MENHSEPQALFAFKDNMKGPKNTVLVRILPISSIWGGMLPTPFTNKGELTSTDLYGWLDEKYGWHMGRAILVADTKNELINFLVRNTLPKRRGDLLEFLSIQQPRQGQVLDGALYLTKEVVDNLRS